MISHPASGLTHMLFSPYVPYVPLSIDIHLYLLTQDSSPGLSYFSVMCGLRRHFAHSAAKVSIVIVAVDAGTPALFLPLIRLRNTAQIPFLNYLCSRTRPSSFCKPFFPFPPLPVPTCTSLGCLVVPFAHPSPPRRLLASTSLAFVAHCFC